MDRFGGGGFELLFGIQQARLGLADRPQDAQQRHKEGKDAQRLVDRKQQHGLRGKGFDLVGRNAARQDAVTHVMGNESQRDQRDDHQRGQPVKAFGDGAIACGGVGKGHVRSPMRRLPQNLKGQRRRTTGAPAQGWCILARMA